MCIYKFYNPYALQPYTYIYDYVLFIMSCCSAINNRSRDTERLILNEPSAAGNTHSMNIFTFVHMPHTLRPCYYDSEFTDAAHSGTLWFCADRTRLQTCILVNQTRVADNIITSKILMMNVRNIMQCRECILLIAFGGRLSRLHCVCTRRCEMPGIKVLRVTVRG